MIELPSSTFSSLFLIRMIRRIFVKFEFKMIFFAQDARCLSQGEERRSGRPLGIIIIIIIIKRGWQCKAGRERSTPYQSEDPNPTTPTHRKKEEKKKTVGDKKGASS